VKLPDMKAGLTISTAAHLALLLWGLISFAARPLEAAQPALPVDIISDKQFSQIAAGLKNAPKATTPLPLVDKVGDNRPVDESAKKVSEKPPVQTQAEPPPSPQEKQEKSEAKPEKKEPPKVDQIGEALKKEEQRKRREEAKAKADDAKKQKEAQQPKFDPKQIAALLDKRDTQRQTATGQTVNQDPSLGYANAPPAQLSQSELDALRRRLSECWSPPVGAANAPNLKVVIRVLFKKDGSVASAPQLVAGTPSPYGPAMAESAKRAILSCQPFNMLRAESYELWKDIEITFDPRDMFRT
jgi:outer membrane biosynthesis protein TonB